LPPWITAEREALIPATSPAPSPRAAFRQADIPNLGLTVGERTAIDALGVFGSRVTLTMEYVARDDPRRSVAE
jgi:hypothetical protein